MNNLNYNAMVLFLVVITSTGLVSYTHSNNDQEIFMVVDDNLSTMQSQQMGILKADNRPVQTGRFKLEDGKLLKLLRATNGRENCFAIDQPCGVLDWCCDDLHCDGFFTGRCKAVDYCLPLESSCSEIRVPCCDDGVCDGIFCGKCKPLDYCLSEYSSCSTSMFPCSLPTVCVDLLGLNNYQCL